MNDYKFQTTNPCNYSLRVYKRVANTTTVLSQTLEEGGVDKEELPKRTSTEFLLFFFRQTPKQEIIAVTSGAAWEVVRSCVNYGVPTTIAGRLLDPHHISEITRRCLLGNDIKETICNPSGRELCKISNIYYLVESFKCRVKIDSSLMSLPLFKKPPEIRVRSGLLRIMKRISLTNYPCLLDLFSRHIQAHKKPTHSLTYDKKKKCEIFDRDFEFLHFLTPVPSAQDALDTRVVTCIFKAFQNNRRQQFSFRHKFLQDFLESDGWEIQLKEGSKFRRLNTRPASIENLIEYLFERDEEIVSSEEKMHEVFAKGAFRYKCKTGEWVKDLLIKFVEGEVRDEKGNSYFKVRGMWYKLAVDFQALLHEDYRGLLRQTLIRPQEEGQLPKPWRGNQLQGHVVEVVIKEKFGISKGIRAFMTKLKGTQVCFIDDKGHIKKAKLVGEILQVEVIRQHQDTIEKKLLSLKKLPSEEEIKQLFGEDAKKIIEELKKKRPVLQPNKEKGPQYVINPFPYPLQSEPVLKGKYDAFVAYLEELNNIYCQGVESEETYNRAYLDPPYGLNGLTQGYLVFDQVCPHNIEPCDVLRFTQETVYLYHVKETLGQHTRDACSQILNAAKEMRSALSTQHEDNFLQLMWREGTKQSADTQDAKETAKWKTKLKQQLESLGEERFYSTFRDKSIVFVYAFLDQGQRPIHEETRIKSCLSPADLELSATPTVYQKLKDHQFLDTQGRLTGKFCASNQERFTAAEEDFSKELYRQMCRYKPTSSSTIAKIELLDTAREVRGLGFEFKICQIQKPEEGLPNESTSSDAASTEDALDPFPLDEPTPTTPKKMIATTTSIENGPVGFVNVGNSCYMNAVLQVLFNIPDIRDKIGDLNETSTDCMQALQSLFQSEDPPTRESLNAFRERVFEESTLEGKFDQQDAHEFLVFVLNLLQWYPMSLVTKNQVDEKHYVSESQEENHHLSVSMENQSTFQGTLNAFFAFEDMVAEEGRVEPLRLEGGGSADQWKRVLYIKGAFPHYLIIQLKRFDNDGNKINSFLAFPEDRKISIQNENEENTDYEITAFIHHHGPSLNQGHYTADIKNFRDPEDEARWIHCNDGELSEREPSDPEHNAYIIVLKKCEPQD